MNHECYVRRVRGAKFLSIPSHDAGGVALLLPRLSQEQADEGIRTGRTRYEALILGRVQSYGLSRNEVGAISSRIRAGAEVAAASPSRATVLLMGDMNYQEAAPMHLHVPEIDKG
eukprot:4154826-Pyramimonas_sp.AAC.1